MLPTLPSSPEPLLNRLKKIQADLFGLQEDLFMHTDEERHEAPAFLRVPGPDHSPNDPVEWAKFLESTILSLRNSFPHRELPLLLQQDFRAMVPPVSVALGEPNGENAKTIFKAIFHLEHLVSEVIDIITFQIRGIWDISEARLCATCYVDLTSFGTEQMDLLMPRRTA